MSKTSAKIRGEKIIGEEICVRAGGFPIIQSNGGTAFGKAAKEARIGGFGATEVRTDRWVGNIGL